MHTDDLQQGPTLEQQLRAITPTPQYKRAKACATLVKKRLGLERHWSLFVFLERLHNVTRSKGGERGLTVEEINNLCLFNYQETALDKMIEDGLLQRQQGFETICYEEEACAPSRPVNFYKLSARLETLLAWRFKEQDC